MPQSAQAISLADPLLVTAMRPSNIIFPSRFTQTLPPPNALTLRFSRASDLDKVLELYSGKRKAQIDPKGYIRPRHYDELAEPVRTGAAALSLDENGNIRAASLAKHFKNAVHPDQSGITELGAVLCDTNGIGLSQALIAMLSLKQTFDPRASSRVYAKVAPDNIASNTVFAKSLGWEGVSSEAESETLYDIAYGSNKGQRDRTWYHFTGAAEDKAADILKAALGRESLTGKTGRSVALNIDASSLWSTVHFHDMLKSKYESEHAL
ncbi:MAG: hypothetical protein ACK4VI_01500 [Alphaproteobacteria bacterium]